MNKPIVAIPIGDCAGIGPEIALKTLNEQDTYNICRPLLIGDSRVISAMIEICDLKPAINVIDEPAKGRYEYGYVDLIDLKNIDTKDFVIGKVQAICGKAAYEFIEKAVSLALERKVDAIATTPINKEALKAANVPFIGHTEIFAHLTDTKDPLTMFEVDRLRVFFLSRHVSLRQAIDLVKKDRIIDYVKRAYAALKRLGVSGTIAVAGLNPHSGEHGLFGNEEELEIRPAVEELKKEGFDVIGPVPADSVFALGLDGRYAAILSLYHDQGHIATKTYDFHRTISITNGMPVLRTSVDHGTAMDIAGKNIANHVSMKEAVRLAARYAPYFVQT